MGQNISKNRNFKISRKEQLEEIKNSSYINDKSVFTEDDNKDESSSIESFHETNNKSKLFLPRKVDEKIECANRLFTQGETEKAIKLITEFIVSFIEENEKNEKNEDYKEDLANLYFCRATIYYKSFKKNETISDLNSCLEIDPEHVNGLMLLGNIYFKENKISQAIKCFKELFYHDEKENVNAALKLAVLYKKLKNYEKSLEYYLVVAKYKPKNVKVLIKIAMTYYFLEEEEKCLEFCEKILEIDENEENALFRIAKIKQKRDERYDARDGFKKIIKKNPNHLNAHFELGNEYVRISRVEEAIESYSQCLKINPTHLNSLTNRASCYMRLDLFDSAKKDYLAAVKLKPKDHKIHFGLGRCFANLKKLGKAVEHMTTAIMLDPENPDYYSTRAHCYFLEPSVKNLNKAREDYLVVATLTKSNDAYRYSNSFVAIASIHQELRQHEKAIQFFNKAEEAIFHHNGILNDDYIIFYRRGDSLRTIGRINEAIKDYTKAIEKILNPKKKSNVLNSRGFAYSEIGDLENAYKDFSASIKLNPGLKMAKDNLEILENEIQESKKRDLDDTNGDINRIKFQKKMQFQKSPTASIQNMGI